MKELKNRVRRWT